MSPLVDLQLPQIPATINFEHVPSPISDELSTNVFGHIKINEHTWTIVYHPSDDIWWVHPRPDGTFYEALYTKLFYNSPIPEQFGYATLETDGIRRTQKAIKNWDDIQPYLPNVSTHRLLEIGCGSGEFLIEAQKRGWKITHGNELEAASAQLAIAKGLTIDTGFFEHYSAPDNGPYHLIFADNVIEHTMDPKNFLRKIYTLLSPNGRLILRLPDTQPYGPTLKLIDHTFHFTRNSMRKILELTGFKVVDIFHSGTFYGSKYQLNPNQKIENMTVVAVKTN